ncbi:MAG: SMI1/KNR4 family protein [Eubacteriales bacterium]
MEAGDRKNLQNGGIDMDISKRTEWLFKREEIKVDNISIVEGAFGVKFPEDYIECVMKNHGGHPTLDIFYIDGRGETVFNWLLSFNSDDVLFIVKIYNDIRDRLVDDIYPFADDPFGNFICFDYRKGKDKPPSIAFWDHELAYEDPEKGIFPICSTFTELLSKLYSY